MYGDGRCPAASGSIDQRGGSVSIILRVNAQGMPIRGCPG